MKLVNTLFFPPNSLALVNNSCSDKALIASGPSLETASSPSRMLGGTTASTNASSVGYPTTSSILATSAGRGPTCRRSNVSSGAKSDEGGVPGEEGDRAEAEAGRWVEGEVGREGEGRGGGERVVSGREGIEVIGRRAEAGL